jgi:hypothetical protein
VLGRIVFDKVARGTLFVLPDGQCCAIPATGQVCAVCDEPILNGIECGVIGPRGSVFAHTLCHSVWCQESQIRRRQRDSATTSVTRETT